LIPEQINKIVASGYKEVVISGINLGDYSTPDGKTFADVVELMDAMKPDLRIRISSIEPNLLNDRILRAVAASDVFCPHFHIPLQSGSPDILKKMKRRYKASFYKDLIYKIKENIPNCGLGIDVIVGFPGESEEHFRETYDLLDELPASYFHVFTYSERDNTPAATYDGIVPVHIRKERTNLLRELSQAKQRSFYAGRVGKIATVIPESYDKSTKTWKSWSENYVRVKFEGDENLAKSFVKVMVESVHGDYAFGSVITD
jgi:threonylcarbamoyladenosine tRNA methylthiotransferase MtaB